MHGQELKLVHYGKLYITRIRASYTWHYVKRNILLRFYEISHACANSGAQAVFSLPHKKWPGNEANTPCSMHAVSLLYMFKGVFQDFAQGGQMCRAKILGEGGGEGGGGHVYQKGASQLSWEVWGAN